MRYLYRHFDSWCSRVFRLVNLPEASVPTSTSSLASNGIMSSKKQSESDVNHTGTAVATWLRRVMGHFFVVASNDK